MRELLAARDDNDPRFDTGFRALTVDERAAFRAEYRATPRERRNELGAIALLLGREAPVPEDWELLREAAGEPPCLSLADCGKAGAEAGPGDETTLAYPALVALTMARRALDAGESAGARAVLKAGMESKAPRVARLAAKLDAKK